MASARVDGARGRAARLRARLGAAPVTVGLVGLCTVMLASTVMVCAVRAESLGPVIARSWIELERCSDTLTTFGALRLADVWLDGDWWRVISAGLLHGSWLHLVLNGWSLWVVGEWVEGTWGHARAAWLFSISSLTGCLASAAWVEAPMVVGASAGIMGMAGALLVGRVLGRGALRAKLEPLSAGVLGGWLAVLVGLGFFVDVIAQAGHLGGLVAGSLLGLAWCDRGPRMARVGIAGLVVILGGLGVAAAHPEGRPRYHELLGYAQLERGRDQEAAASLERALEQRPDDPGLANAIAYALAKAGKELERAEALVREALEAEPDNADYLDTLGWVLCRRGDPSQGMEALRKASEASGGAVEEIEGHLAECPGAAVE